jgi:IS5 family transposase
VLTGERAFFTVANQQLAEDLHMRSIALPRQGPIRTEDTRAQRRAFRRAYRRRAGIECRISVLNRRFGLNRCRYRGEAGM